MWCMHNKYYTDIERGTACHATTAGRVFSGGNSIPLTSKGNSMSSIAVVVDGRVAETRKLLALIKGVSVKWMS